MASGCGDEEGNTEGGLWRLIGPATGLSKQRCRLMYSSLGRSSDVCLFYVKGEFFAMDARCAHSGNASLGKLILAPISLTVTLHMCYKLHRYICIYIKGYLFLLFIHPCCFKYPPHVTDRSVSHTALYMAPNLIIFRNRDDIRDR